MPRFNAAKSWKKLDDDLSGKFNYLCDLLDEGYSSVALINNHEIAIDINPKDGIKIVNDGSSIFSLDPLTGEIVIGKYDGLISDLETDLGTAYNDIAQQLGYTDYDDMVSEAIAGNTIINGGWLRTSLIQANTILFDQLASATVTSITGTLNIGGRNLLEDTTDADTTDSYASYILLIYPLIRIATFDKFVAGDELTCRVYIENDTSHTQTLRVIQYNGTSQVQNSYGDAIASGSEGFSEVTFTVHASADLMRIYLSSTPQTQPTGTVTYRKLKLEFGNKATDWTPAPEDKLSEGVSYAGVEIDATNGFVSTATIGGNTIQTKANATDGFSIYKGANKIFGVDTDGNLFSSRLSNAETPTAWSIVGEITQGGTTRRGIFGYNSAYSSSAPGFMFLVPSYGGMTALVQNGETIAFSDAYTSPSVVSNHYLLSLGEASGYGSFMFGAYDGAGTYKAGMDLNYNSSSGYWEFTLDVGDVPLTINDAGFRYDSKPVWYQGNVDFDTGSGTSSSSAGGDTKVSFGKTFSSAPKVVANTTGANSYTCRIKSVSTTGFVLVVSGSSIGFNWIAVLT